MAKDTKDAVEETPAPDKAPASPADAKRAVAAARDELKAVLAKKKQNDRALATLETTLYAFETSYLAPPPSDTGPSTFGNIIKGYDQYLKAPNMGGSSHHTTFASDRNKRRAGLYGTEVREEERLFSRSSDTYLLSLDLKDREQQGPSSSEEEDVTGSRKKARR